MTTINQLSAVDAVVAGDLVPIFSTSNGDARKAAMSVLKTYILGNFMSDLDASVEALVDADLFAIYDASQRQSVSVTADLVRAYIQAQLFTSLTAAGAVTAADQLVIFEDSVAATRSVTAAQLLTYLQSALLTKFATQYASPSASGFSVQITDSSVNTHLILTPTAGYAAGTIVLPAVANCIDKQEVLVNCTQQVIALTVNGNGAVAVTGEPTALGADDFFRLKYDLTTQTWFRVG